MKSTRRFPGSAPSRRLPAGRRGLAAALLAATAVLAVAAGCHRESPRPDVLLVTIDTLRRDHCSLYGYPVPTTPNLDALAARGVRFDHAYAESATTAPSHAVLMTGRHFRTLGVRKNGAVVAGEDVTLAEALRDAGYQTAGFVSSFPLMTRFGFSQGFEAYDDAFDLEEASIGRRKEDSVPHDRYAGATLGRLARWLAGNTSDKPLFLWVHFVDPHAPYRAPEAFESTWPEGTPSAVMRYDAEVHYADAELGKLFTLLDVQRPGRERLTVVTSDHGEGLGDHGWMSHGINLHEEAVRVPMVASWPKHLDAGKAVAAPVSLVDVAPGILGLLGIDGPTFSDGRDLFGQTDTGRPIFLQRREYKSRREKGVKVGGDMTAVVQDGTKLIVAPVESVRELYDLASDPKELLDLLGGAPKPSGIKKRKAVAAASAGRTSRPPAPARLSEAARLEKVLDQWAKDHPEAQSTEAPLDKEALKALRSLGYVD